MSDTVGRFIVGNIDRINLGSPRTFTRKDGTEWNAYSLRITEGYYQDTNEPVENQYFNSKYPVSIFIGKETEAVKDRSEFDGHTIRGSIYVKQVTFDDGHTAIYLNAVQVIQDNGVDESVNSAANKNPFLDNPFE